MEYNSSDSGNFSLHKREFVSTASFSGSGTGETAGVFYPVTGDVEISGLRRYGLYLSYLRLMRLRGRTDLSVESIASETGIHQNQVEEDLIGHGFMLAGQKAVHISSLMLALEKILGYYNETESFLVGAGKLGTSLLLKENLGQTSLKIVAAFDTDYRKIGSLIGSIRVMSPEKIIPLAARMHVSLGIIATPAGEASHVADLLAGAGMKAIWNFTADNIDPGPGIIVEQTRPGQDIAAAYERIIHRLRSQAVH
ncbi:NADH/NAD ratio-sensing transcriptional regulator Rex [Lentimicrobium saccharophilum]|uniref:Redox-sensing transcriptional repressor Rex n=1 Tax=Lentimicrobium saccharophilum TaxID=1678841 RepID=A0A0S7C330_9BACT|nr:redox-sensing transcriptional repressor Rex [Lentimicrobium saccharophilum]GAP43167.1 NADH/NAD ratio-sensing transcriptional regulator Rex [Lentimicrobium saccharophilum]